VLWKRRNLCTDNTDRGEDEAKEEELLLGREMGEKARIVTVLRNVGKRLAEAV